MEIIQKSIRYNGDIGLEYNDDVLKKEELIEWSDVEYFSLHEINLLKKWHDIWLKAYEDDVDVWEVKKKIREEFEKDDYNFIFQFEFLMDLYDYEPEDFQILEDGLVKINKRIIKNLTVEFMPNTKYNVLIEEYVVGE